MRGIPVGTPVHTASSPLWRGLCAVLVLAAVLFLPTCGLPGDGSLERVVVPPGPTAPERADSAPDGEDITVWFVRGARLEAVPRSAEDPGSSGALGLLLAGPTLSEVREGLRTALTPVDLTVLPRGPGSRTLTIAVGQDFADIGGGNQVLAVAQVVWTATQFPPVDRVCFTLEGRPVEVPTDQGLVDRPVGRADYLSIAPPPARPTARPSGPSGQPSADRGGTVPPTPAPACPSA